MPNLKKQKTIMKVAAGLFIGGIVLELTSLVIAFTIGHPHTDVCPHVSTIVPDVCFYLSLSALIVTLSALITAIFSHRMSFVLPYSIVLIVLIVVLAPVILIQAGAGINWCNYAF